MLNINDISNKTEEIKNKLTKRNKNYDTEITEIIKLNLQRKKIIFKVENLKAEKNKLTKEISFYLKQNDNKMLKEIKNKIKFNDDIINNSDKKLNLIYDKINKIIEMIPNIIDDSVPNGIDDNDNIEIKNWKKDSLKKIEINHADICVNNEFIDIKRAVKISGSRFVMYTKKGAKLLRALINELLSININNGYEEILTPLLVNKDIVFGTGQLPKFEDDLYKTTNEQYLIPTTEVPLTNFYKDEEIKKEELPIKFTGYSQCFRKESDSGGKDIKGLIRLHQFNKVELIKISHPENSFEELELLVKDIENILQKFELPYRVMLLCSGDTGFSSTKTYDLEVWMPGQNKYREISSCSNCLDFQARRINLKYRDDNKKLQFVHTLNGSGVAIDRLFAAIIENNYENGKIRIPSLLKKYFNNEEFL